MNNISLRQATLPVSRAGMGIKRVEKVAIFGVSSCHNHLLRKSFDLIPEGQYQISKWELNVSGSTDISIADYI